MRYIKWIFPSKARICFGSATPVGRKTRGGKELNSSICSETKNRNLVKMFIQVSM